MSQSIQINQKKIFCPQWKVKNLNPNGKFSSWNRQKTYIELSYNKLFEFDWYFIKKKTTTVQPCRGQCESDDLLSPSSKDIPGTMDEALVNAFYHTNDLLTNKIMIIHSFIHSSSSVAIWQVPIYIGNSLIYNFDPQL